MKTLRQRVADHMIEHGGWLTSKDIAISFKEPTIRISKTLFSMFEHDKWYMNRKEEGEKIYYKLTGYNMARSNALYRTSLESYLLRRNGSRLTISMAQRYVQNNFGCTVASSTVSKYCTRLGVKLTGPGGRNKKEVTTKPTKENLWSIALGI